MYLTNLDLITRFSKCRNTFKMEEGGNANVSCGLLTKDEIEVATSNGPCKIQLAYGSVTSLPKEEEVDVLVVSAFPSKYFKSLL